MGLQNSDSDRGSRPSRQCVIRGMQVQTNALNFPLVGTRDLCGA